jgi:maleamate amidohydrolase
MSERIWDQFLTAEDKEVLAVSGWGARAGYGKRPALLVVDVNYAFCGDKPEPILDSIKRWRNSCGPYAWKALPVIRFLIDACRKKGVPVIYTTSGYREDGWDRGSWEWKNARMSEDASSPRKYNRYPSDIMDEIAPVPEDIVIRKLKPSAFSGSPLKSYLTLLGADSVIVTGTTTSGCVRGTVMDAFSENLRVIVSEDGCFDRSVASHAINLCDMNAKYGDVVPSNELIEYIKGLPSGLFELPKGASRKAG